jgi:hypothetical protein
VSDGVGVTARLVDAIAARDFAAIRGCLADGARLRALVPARLREEDGADHVLERMRFWWGAADRFELLESEVEPLADRVRFRYRLRCHDAEQGWTVLEQAGFATLAGGRIEAIDLVCSGDRPAEPPPG